MPDTLINFKVTSLLVPYSSRIKNKILCISEVALAEESRLGKDSVTAQTRQVLEVIKSLKGVKPHVRI